VNVWVLGNTTGQAAEDAAVRPTPLVGRPEHEKLVLDAGRGRTLRTAVIRPGIVYGGGRGIIADLLKTANGLVRVIGDGRNHWACSTTWIWRIYMSCRHESRCLGVYPPTTRPTAVADIVAVARHAKMQPTCGTPIGEARPNGSMRTHRANQIVRVRARSGMDADAAFRGRQRGAPARRVPRET
jgi:hypothetical protein